MHGGWCGIGIDVSQRHITFSLKDSNAEKNDHTCFDRPTDSSKPAQRPQPDIEAYIQGCSDEA